jgi:hypothetical protein
LEDGKIEGIYEKIVKNHRENWQNSMEFEGKLELSDELNDESFSQTACHVTDQHSIQTSQSSTFHPSNQTSRKTTKFQQSPHRLASYFSSIFFRFQSIKHRHNQASS